MRRSVLETRVAGLPGRTGIEKPLLNDPGDLNQLGARIVAHPV